jgi:hypothetical protein
VIALATVALACGSSSSDADAQAAAKQARQALAQAKALSGGSSTGGTVTSTTEPTKLSKFKIRFFNDLVDGTNPGPTIDIYDDLGATGGTTVTKLPKGAVPIVKNLKFGQFSDYVIPHELAGIAGQGEVDFAAVESGKPLGPTNQPTNAGGLSKGTSAPQGTEVISAPDEAGLTNGLDGRDGLTSGVLVEKTGGTNGDSPPSTAPSGQAVFALDTSTIPKADNGGGTYFFIDDSCTPPINGDGNKAAPDIFSSGAMADQDGPFPFFPTTPGSHGLAITFWSQNTDATCADVTPTAPQSTVTVNADTVYLTIPYGVDAQHIQIAVGAIAQ